MKKYKIHLSFKVLTLSWLLIIYHTSVFAYSGYVGESITLPAPSVPGTIGGAAWYSDDNSLVFVSGNHYSGNAEIVKYFSGEITVYCQYSYSYYSGGKTRYGNGTTKYSISCLPSNITLNKSSITLKPGEEFEFSYTNSSGYELPKVEWSIDNQNVAEFAYDTFTDGGYAYGQTISVVANKPGQCTLTCNGYNGGKAVTCAINVMEIPATSISVNPSSISLRERDTEKLTYTISPIDATSNVTWSSSDENVVTVSSKGQISAINAGNAIVFATTDNGLTAECNVEVLPLPTSISLSDNTTTIGYYLYLTPIVTPSNAISQYRWESSDPLIASVDISGKVLGKRTGTATITVTSDNNVTSSCKITVKEPAIGMDHLNVGVRCDALNELIKKSLNNLK